MSLRLGLLAVAAMLPAWGEARAADPSTLWRILNDRCVPHEETAGDPAPCAEVDLSGGRERGFVVLKDIVGIAQFLLMPTARIAGIESPELLQPGLPNYWELAWRARSFMNARLGTELPRDAVSLAVNSSFGRTQNQLHIHIDCVRADVRAALTGHMSSVGREWSSFTEPLAGHHYRVMRVSGSELGGNDPFRLVASSEPGAATDMGSHTIVVVGANFPDQGPGFIVLDDRADLVAGNRASGEELQDHGCAVAKTE